MGFNYSNVSKKRKLIAGLSIGALVLSGVVYATAAGSGLTNIMKAKASGDEVYCEQMVYGSAADIVVEYSNFDLNESYDESTSTAITCSGGSAEIKGEGATVENSIINITLAGTYILSGDFSGQIKVLLPDTDKAQLVMNNFSITYAADAPIYVEQADKVSITLAEGTKNYVNDTGTGYVDTDDSETEDTGRFSSAIHSKSGLTINGTGDLIVTSSYNKGIFSKKNLRITNGNVTVESEGVALKGKNSVAIKAGNINLATQNDGIKTDEEEDTEKGYICIDGGDITITSLDNGIKASQYVIIHDGKIDVTTTGTDIETENSYTLSSDGSMIDENGNEITDQNMQFSSEDWNTIIEQIRKWSGWGDWDDWFDDNDVEPEPAKTSTPSTNAPAPVKTNSPSTMVPAPVKTNSPSTMAPAPDKTGAPTVTTTPAKTNAPTKTTSPSKTTSPARTGTPTTMSPNQPAGPGGPGGPGPEGNNTKIDGANGIKAGTDVYITGGDIDIHSTGHSVKSEGTLEILDNADVYTNAYCSQFQTNSKGLASVGTLTISGGNIDIEYSYEGIESKSYIVIEGGHTELIASDDGINAAGTSSANCGATITGGYLYVDARGDGLDSNGNLTVTGGDIVVKGPTNDGNGPIDIGEGGCTFKVDGGNLLAYGSSGMAVYPSTSSTQGFIGATVSINSGTIVSILNSNKESVYTFEAQQATKSICLSLPVFSSGEQYYIYTGGTYTGGDCVNGVYSGGSYSGGSSVTTVTVNSSPGNSGPGRR